MSAPGWERSLFRGVRPPRSEPQTVDVERSHELSQRIRAQDRRCYENVLRALPLVSGARLVIGFAASIGARCPRRHAWLESADGRTIYEVTPSWQAGGPKIYHPARRYGGRTAAARFRRLLNDEAVTWRTARETRAALRAAAEDLQEDARLRAAYETNGEQSDGSRADHA